MIHKDQLHALCAVRFASAAYRLDVRGGQDGPSGILNVCQLGKDSRWMRRSDHEYCRVDAGLEGHAGRVRVELGRDPTRGRGHG